MEQVAHLHSKASVSPSFQWPTNLDKDFFRHLIL